MNFNAMVARYIELIGLRPLILVWGVPNGGERSVFSFNGWCFGDRTCKRTNHKFYYQDPDTYDCQRCGRPRGDGLMYGRWHG